MSQPIIEVSGLGKKYRLGEFGARSLREEAELLWNRFRKPRHAAIPGAHQPGGVASGSKENEFWALKDVSFTVQPGDVVGIIGRNGAGKSTLLKILSRITEPTEGDIVMRGRVASLLEVGTGFHPELSGRDNIYLNGAILGMRKPEIDRKFDEIVAFAEVAQFIDTPVKRYSSGMYVRLAFAVAAHLEPEILVVDEVLAVGDAEFQKKCLGKMKEVSRAGRTVLFVSHSMMAIQSLCSSGLVLKAGQVEQSGSVDVCVAAYLASGAITKDSVWRRAESPGSRICYFESASVALRGLSPDQVLDIDLLLRSAGPHAKTFLAADIVDATGVVIMQALPTLEPFLEQSVEGRALRISVQLPPLIPGLYSVTLWVGTHNTTTLDQVDQIISFEIVASPTVGRTFPHSRDHGFLVPVSTVQTLPL